jgi:hypothetical protein
MLKLQQQGIERALVESQKVSADLLNAPCNAVAVLRAQHIESFQHHERKRSLQNVRLFLHERANL